ncbi:MAG: FRG domain-containing protein [Cyanobacteria bacterium P01_G01_bin.67]
MKHKHEYRPTCWAELIDLLYDIPQTSFGRIRSNYVYRGVANANWSLDTSLQRLGGTFHNLERPLLRNFKKYATPGEILDSNKWVQISVAQHHGLPTRLLDWTTSPQVALHFATKNLNHYYQDGVIWCVDVVAAHKILPQDLKQILTQESANVFSVEMLEKINLEDFDQLGLDNPFVLFFEPPSLDARIVNQHAILSAMPGAELLLHDFLINHPNLYKRIIVPSEIKWEARDKLDQDNVCETTLFPGLDGLSSWLKRYYSPKTTMIEKIADVGKEITQLLSNFSPANPLSTDQEKFAVICEVLEKIQNNVPLKNKIMSIHQAKATAALKYKIDHPLAKILVATIESWKLNQ